ncbi:hypothetical protein ACFQI7_31550 [Paenibacillus allorhizosphaerae]|uniref:Secreted protein n=1 Tax=Paenibacillus allorhizosphaerae TaxID=2849866 RepID=A0ABM8VPZ5_9BACL|nr:hypothetical protein [Paenibacillus allorhizosphaerae]CAG7653568.1 hypothetical protein PAECIP111802_05523 [Paenibacillus allorhizosphaerae]
MSPEIIAFVIILLLLASLAIRAAMRKPGRPRKHDQGATDSAHSFGLTDMDADRRHHHNHHNHHHNHHPGDSGHHGHGHGHSDSGGGSDSGGDGGGGGD